MTWNYNKLEQIKGIGKETVKDIADMYDEEEKLITDLKHDRSELRNDIANLLKDYYEEKELDNTIAEVSTHDLKNVRCNSCNLSLPEENKYGICPYCGRIN